MKPVSTFIALAGSALMASCGVTLPDSCSGAKRPPTKLLLHPDSAVPGEYIVVFYDSVRDIPGTARTLTTKYSGTLLFIYEAALRGFALNIDDSKARPLSDEPAVCFVEQSQETHTD